MYFKNYKAFLIPLYFFIFLFSYYSGAHPHDPGEDTDHYHTDPALERDRFEYQQDRDRAADKREANRLRSEALREQQRERKEQEREMRDRCERAEDDIQAQMKENKQEKEKWEEKFYDLEGKITELESKNSEKQTEINEKLDELKKDINKTVQDFKDDMAEELKEVDEEVKELKRSIGELHEELRKVEETRMTAFYARRKQQNEFYSKCFGKALEQTEKERSAFYQKTATRTLRRKNIGSLISGGKTQTKNVFSARFNSFLHLCLNNQAALLEKQNQKDEYELTLKKLHSQEEGINQKIAGIKAQIAKLNTTGKVEVMTRFKQKMEAELNTFNQSYDALTANHQRGTQQTIREIEKIKQQQAYTLMSRAQIVPQKTRSTMINSQCQGLNVFNMFNTLSTPSGGRGIFNSSTGSGVVR
jgi:hypothetical protein